MIQLWIRDDHLLHLLYISQRRSNVTRKGGTSMY